MAQSEIGRVHYQPAREVSVRDDDGTPHKAVHGTFAIYVDTKIETDILLDRWDDIAASISETVDNFLSDAEDVASGEVV